MVKRISESNEEPLKDMFIEYQRIETLFSIDRCICSNRFGMPIYPATWSLEEFFNLYLFKSWNLRGRCISVGDKRTCLDIDNLSTEKRFTKDKFLIFIEYVMNIVYQIDINKSQFNISFVDIHYLTNVFENCISILDNLNYETEKTREQMKYILLRKIQEQLLSLK